MSSPFTRSKKVKRSPEKATTPTPTPPQPIPPPTPCVKPIPPPQPIPTPTPCAKPIPSPSPSELSEEPFGKPIRPTTPCEEQKMEGQLRTLVKQREAVRGKLLRVCAALDDSAEGSKMNTRNIRFLQLQKRALDQIYIECNEVQNKIYALPLDEDVSRLQDDEYVEFEAEFNDVSLHLLTLIDVVPKAEPAAAAIGMPAQPAAQPYLPPLQVPLPTFDGSYEKWYSFKAMFTTVMNRYKHEEPALKLFHLRNSLIGKAAGIIDDEMVHNNDYEAAWTVLTQRYEDVRIVVDKHVENLLGLPKFGQDNGDNLRKIIDACTKNTEALKHHNLPLNGLSEQMLVIIIAGKMDRKLRVAWEARQTKNVLPTYAAMLTFLEDQCRVSEKLNMCSRSVVEIAKAKVGARGHTLAVSETAKCPVCHATHELWRCDAFKHKPITERFEILKREGACFNCLVKGHRTRTCASGACRICGKKHHTSLHEDRPSQLAANEASTMPAGAMHGGTPTASANAATTLCASSYGEKQTVLSTAIILVDGLCSSPYPCRVLLDSASQMNFVTQRFANLLSVKSTPTDYTVSGLNGAKTRISRKLRTVIRSRDGEYSKELEFLVTPRITGELPVKSFGISEWPIEGKLMLADPTLHQRGRIDMLIGAECFWDLLKDGRCELGPNRPVLRNTKLGWIAGGVIASDATVVARTLCQMADEEPLIKLVKSFYQVEGCDEFRPLSTPDDEACVEHFRRTHERTKEGRYIVRHPFNERKHELGDSREMALRRFLALERKLDRQPELKEQYSQFIREYEQLGHMREVKEVSNEDPGSAFYLPHHCVLKPSSSSTKLRVVFDGSAKSSTGVSINDVLMIGPTIQNELTAILLRFRGFQFVFTLDIPKMFRQVGVHPADTKYQRIFWRYNKNQCLTVRELLTVTYGLGPSPFQATMVLKQAALDHQDEFPMAAEVIEKGTYMDDILTGADTLAEACQLQREVTGLLAKACFGAHKWCVNHPDMAQGIPEELRGNSFEVTDGSSKTIVKTLGVTWNPLEDWFSVSVPGFDDVEEITRRKLLSQLAKIFDPLGFFGPVLTFAKLILREVGEMQIEWDDPVSKDVSKKWRSFRNEMTALREVRLPR